MALKKVFLFKLGIALSLSSTSLAATYETCQSNAQAQQAKCHAALATVAASNGAVAQQAENTAMPEGIRTGGAAEVTAGNSSAMNNTMGAQECSAAKASCIQTCQQAVQHHQQLGQQYASSIYTAAKAPPEFSKASQSTGVMSLVCNALDANIAEAANSAVQSMGLSQLAGMTRDAATGNSQGGADYTTAIGAGLAGAMLGNMMNQDGEKKENSPTSNNLSSGGDLGSLGVLAGQNGSLSADSQEIETSHIDCALDENINKSDCEASLLAGCASNPEGANCSQFTDHYCGFDSSVSNASAQFTQNGSSDYCKKQQSERFCASGGRSMCLSCQESAAINSSTQVALAQAECPTDPIFSDPDYLSKLVSAANTDAAQIQPILPTGGFAQTANLSTGQNQSEANEIGGGFGAIASTPQDTSMLATPAVVGDAALIGSAAGQTPVTANLFNQAAQGQVGEKSGSSLFARTSAAVAGQCLAGQLNGCGALTEHVGAGGIAANK